MTTNHLLLASLDAARAQLSKTPGAIFDEAIDLSIMAKELLAEIPGMSVLDLSSFPDSRAMDPLRLTVGFWQLGISGYEANEILYRDHGVVSEFAGPRCITFALNLGTQKEHTHRLVSAIKHVYAASASNIAEDPVIVRGDLRTFVDVRMGMSPREAFTRKRKVKTEESTRKICGELICPYPPGIPVLNRGEIITEQVLDYLLGVKRGGVLITGASDPTLSSVIVCD